MGKDNVTKSPGLIEVLSVNTFCILLVQFLLVPLFPIITLIQLFMEGLSIKNKALSTVFKLILVFLNVVISWYGLNVIHAEWKSLFNIPDSWLLYLIFSILTVSVLNVMILLFLALVDYPNHLIDAFSAKTQDAVWEWQKHIMGHKIWAGEDTKILLEELSNDKDIGKARWLIINFLSQIMEDVQTEDYSVKNSEPWPIYKYSTFLSKNIDHSSEIMWSLGPNDFFGVIFPNFYLYTLIIIGKIHYEYELDLSKGKKVLSSRIHSASKSISKLILEDKAIEINHNNDDNILTLYNDMLPTLTNIGLSAMAEGIKRITKQQILNEYDKLLEYNLILPHLKAFQQSSANKSRYLCFTNISTNKDASGKMILHNEIDLYWPKSKKAFFEFLLSIDGYDNFCKEYVSFYNDRCQNRKSNTLSPKSKKITRSLIRTHSLALELFAYSCGGKKNFRIKELDEDTIKDIEEYDIGVYEKKILVKSKPSDEDTSVGILNYDMKRRDITWRYYADENSCKIYSDITSANEANYRAFVKALIKYISNDMKK